MLREARSTRVAVLHEFLTQYDGSLGRVHAFFEGYDDVAFFLPFLRQYAPEGTQVIPYRCEGKARVFEAFQEITKRVRSVRSVLFFVDKDLDDILGVPWPTDPRIFTTDVYSVENYLVSRSTLESLLRGAVRLRDVNFDESIILRQFEDQLDRFQRLMLPVMAWIITVRRAGARLTLADVSLTDICHISAGCEVRAVKGGRLKALQKSEESEKSGSIFRRMTHAARELRRLPPKRILRGKFEAWFFVEFWRRLVQRLADLAAETGGKATIKIKLEHSNFVPLLSAYVAVPRSLEMFLEAHFPRTESSPIEPLVPKQWTIGLWWRRMVAAIRRRG
jgi:hypothetical protein